MKEQKDYLEDISSIRNIMERSTKFKSLSGISGVLAGIYGLLSSYLAYYHLEFKPSAIQYSHPRLNELLILSLVTLSLAIGTALLLAFRNSIKAKEKFWNLSSKRLLLNLGLPLIIASILIFFLAKNEMIGLVAPFSLIFYGLGIFNASKFSYTELGVMGILNIILGLLSIFFIPYSIHFWTIGFGVFHIIFGVYIYYKYEIETHN